MGVSFILFFPGEREEGRGFEVNKDSFLILVAFFFWGEGGIISNFRSIMYFYLYINYRPNKRKELKDYIVF